MSLAASRARPLLQTAALLLGTAFVVAAPIVSHSVAIPATRWMNIYDTADFPTLSNLASFLANLRVPIPPVIATLEIISEQVMGSAAPVTIFLYRSALILNFLIPPYLASHNPRHLLGSLVASVVFSWGTVHFHPWNPQVYDVLFPLFLLLWILFLRLALLPPWRPWFQIACALLAGFFLSMAELSRPFVLLILPIAIVGTWQALRLMNRRLPLVMIAPIVLLTGGWHVHLAISQHQLFWSNHSGFNLSQAWPQVEIPPYALIPEDDNQPVSPGRWPNINTAEHSANSATLSSLVIEYALSHPGDAVRHILGRLLIYLEEAVPLSVPPHLTLPVGIYRLAVTVALLLLVANLLPLIVFAVSLRARAWLLLANTDNLLILVGCASFLLLALGSSVEETRLALSILPILAVLPRATFAGPQSSRPLALRRATQGLFAAGALLTLTGGLWDIIRGSAFNVGHAQMVILAAGAVFLALGIRTCVESRSAQIADGLPAPSGQGQ